jgi:hypothetical protein
MIISVWGYNFKEQVAAVGKKKEKQRRGSRNYNSVTKNSKLPLFG